MGLIDGLAAATAAGATEAEANAANKLERNAEREKPLRDWLDRNHAVMAWSRPASQFCPEVRCYLIKGVPVIATFFKHGGWNLFVPSAPHSNRIDTSLDQAAVSIGNGCLGCLGCRGLAPDDATKGG